jgi:hypothetical protein
MKSYSFQVISVAARITLLRLARKDKTLIRYLSMLQATLISEV